MTTTKLSKRLNVDSAKRAMWLARRFRRDEEQRPVLAQIHLYAFDEDGKSYEVELNEDDINWLRIQLLDGDPTHRIVHKPGQERGA